jgi:hypothetical protein
LISGVKKKERWFVKMPRRLRKEKTESKCNSVSETNAGIALGLITGLSLFLLGLSAVFLSYGNLYVLVLSSMLIGFDATITGSFVGLIWGFIWGFLLAYLVVWIYKKLE